MNQSVVHHLGTMTRHCLAALLFLAWIGTAGATILITDLEGSVRRDGKTLELLSQLAPKDRLQLGPGARAVVAFVAHAREYTLTGPGEFRVEAAALVAKPGSPQPVPRELPAVYRQIRLDTSRLGQAGVRLRAATGAPELLPSGLVAEAPRLFRWAPVTGAEAYVFRLADAKRNLIYEARLLDPALTLPETLKLRRGAIYYWGIEIPGSGREASWTRLHIASNPIVAKRLESARPDLHAPRSERALFALATETGLPD
ncbi:MAG: hypothetical protein HYZ17_00105 [Betaproteobacteria bacterium]|nr:hypothetical protein [Betaproteobacteria bacterium]